MPHQPLTDFFKSPPAVSCLASTLNEALPVPELTAARWIGYNRASWPASIQWAVSAIQVSTHPLFIGINARRRGSRGPRV